MQLHIDAEDNLRKEVGKLRTENKTLHDAITEDKALVAYTKKLESDKARLIEALRVSNKHIQDWWKPDGELPPAKSYEIVENNDALIKEMEGKPNIEVRKLKQ